MRKFYVATETYNSSDEELTIENFYILIEHKNDIIQSLISKVDDLQEEWEQDGNPLLSFGAICRNKHLLRKCPLSSLKIFKICEEDHLMENCLALLRLLQVLKKSSKESNRLPGITQNPLPFDTWNNAYFPE